MYIYFLFLLNEVTNHSTGSRHMLCGNIDEVNVAMSMGPFTEDHNLPRDLFLGNVF